MKTAKERRTALVRRLPEWTPRCLHEVLDEAAREFPDRDYVIGETGTQTYAEVAQRSRAIAGALKALGVGKGEHVAVIMANFTEFVALKYAISRVGAVCVPINFLNRRDEIGYVLRQSDAVFLVTMDRFRDLDYLAALDDLAPGWAGEGGGAAFPKLRQVVVMPTGDDHVPTGAMHFDQLQGAYAPYDGEAGRDPDAVSDIIYTSGTTGSPKGVLMTHEMLLRAAFGSVYARAFDDGWRVTFSLPMYHVYGYVEGMLTVPFVGGAIIPQRVFDPVATLDAIDRHRADDVLLVPTMTVPILDVLRDAPRPLDSLRAVISSGQRSPAWIWDDIDALLTPQEVTTGYGMTEVTATMSMTRPEDPRQRRTSTNGRMRDVGPAGDPDTGRLAEFRITDPETGQAVPDGSVGEIMARGLCVTAGYYNKPEETEAAFDSDGWLHTGDLGQFDENGYLLLVGRLKETYRCGGEQVMPTEIEDLLVTHPAVLQAHVVPVPDARMGEAGAAYVVLRDTPKITPEELLALCRERLARFKVPKYMLPIPAAELPTTPSGRARKFLLTQRAIAELDLSDQ
ncbi:AMP-binding protein [Sulfitobacter sp. HNIBRBA3233]|uniref:class I adenylate-forming enzyme family protein n=1 Tax=Sulfitobacter marinivivus TaxID=3158558 RepID=UPI0032DED27B